MSQIVTQKQCTESKTGLGAQVHTQLTLAGRMVRLGCTQCVQATLARRTLGYVVAMPRPCRRPRRPYRGPVLRAPARIASLPLAVSQPWLCCIAIQPVTTPSLPPSHGTINCIVTHLSQTVRLSRYKYCIVTQPPSDQSTLLSRYKQLYRDTLQSVKPPPVTIQNLYRDTLPCDQAFSCHDTIDCIVTLTPSQVLSLSRYNLLYRDTLHQPKLPPPITIQSDCIVTCFPAHARQNCYVTIQFPLYRDPVGQ